MLHVIHPTRRVLSPILANEDWLDPSTEARALLLDGLGRRITHRSSLINAGLGGVFLALGFVIHRYAPPAHEELGHFLIFLSFLLCGLPAIRSVGGKLAKFSIDIDVLMLLGAGLAVWIGSPAEGSLLLFLFALSGALEEFALSWTHGAIADIQKLIPSEADVLRGDRIERVPLRRLQIGDIVVVRPGEKTPADGKIVNGISSVDESAITGESIPRQCRPNDVVFAGTQNLDGRLDVFVTRRASESTLAKVVELVAAARHKPARTQRLVDRIGPPYSLGVIVAAVSVGSACYFLFDIGRDESIRRAIAVLIAASPCALIIATPVAYLSAIAGCARRGILMKGGAFLESLANSTTFFFDKTGTLTSGKIRLHSLVPPSGVLEVDALALAGSLEASSTHPLAVAVKQAMDDRKIAPVRVDNAISVPGESLSAVVDGRSVWIGRMDQVPADHVELWATAERLRSEGRTVSAMRIEERFGLLAFEDSIRPVSQAVITSLRKQGVTSLRMLTGDHPKVAQKVATEIGLDGFRANLKPLDKVEAIGAARAERGVVVLIGDGINDAPALATADVGIAMGGLGAAIALEAAHVVLLNDRFDLVPWLLSQGRRTQRIVSQNLVFALGVIAVLCPFAALGAIPLPLAVVGHEGSTILVALNALRLLGKGRKAEVLHS